MLDFTTHILSSANASGFSAETSTEIGTMGDLPPSDMSRLYGQLSKQWLADFLSGLTDRPEGPPHKYLCEDLELPGLGKIDILSTPSYSIKDGPQVAFRCDLHDLVIPENGYVLAAKSNEITEILKQDRSEIELDRDQTGEICLSLGDKERSLEITLGYSSASEELEYEGSTSEERGLMPNDPLMMSRRDIPFNKESFEENLVAYLHDLGHILGAFYEVLGIPKPRFM